MNKKLVLVVLILGLGLVVAGLIRSQSPAEKPVVVEKSAAQSPDAHASHPSRPGSSTCVSNGGGLKGSGADASAGQIHRKNARRLSGGETDSGDSRAVTLLLRVRSRIWTQEFAFLF